MEQVFIDDYIRDALAQFGKGVNTERQLVLDLDGLKPVYRRTIFTALGLGNRLTKTASISGNCIAKYHPHSSDAVDAVVSALVRWGIFEGQGNHGLKMIYGDDIYPAASRYTEAKLSDAWNGIFADLMPYVPYREAEIEGNMEPEYLPTPLPMILLFSGLGIGFGANARYPMFTPNSMLDALLEDNPYLLEAPFGLTIDKEESELWELWQSGLGRITYKYDVQKCGISSGYGTMVSGSPEIFKPDLKRAFNEELEKGQVYILDQTSSDIPKVFIGRSPGVRAVTEDDIYETCVKVCRYQKMFRLTVSDGNSVSLIPLSQWLKKCYDNYLDLVNKFKADKIEKLNFDLEVYNWLPTITNALIKHRNWDAEDLADHCDCNLDVVKAILRKSISTLRNVDSTEKIKGIKSEIENYTKLDPEQYTFDLVNRM